MHTYMYVHATFPFIRLARGKLRLALQKNHRRRKQIVSGEVGAGRLIWKLEKQQKSTRTIMLNIGRCVLSDFLMKKVTRFPIINLRRNWFCPCEFLCWNRSICQRRNLRGFFFLFHLFQLYFFDRCMYVSATDRQNVDSVWYSYFVRTATCASTSTQIISM